VIGTGRVFAFREYEAEGAPATRQHGTIKLYSGGQRGAISKLYAQVSIRAGQASFVIPITVKRMGPGRSELTATLPRLDGGSLTIAELLLSVHRTVNVGGRSIGVMSVRCPTSDDAEPLAQASFLHSTSISATAALSCAS